MRFATIFCSTHALPDFLYPRHRGKRRPPPDRISKAAARDRSFDPRLRAPGTWSQTKGSPRLPETCDLEKRFPTESSSRFQRRVATDDGVTSRSSAGLRAGGSRMTMRTATSEAWPRYSGPTSTTSRIALFMGKRVSPATARLSSNRRCCTSTGRSGRSMSTTRSS